MQRESTQYAKTRESVEKMKKNLLKVPLSNTKMKKPSGGSPYGKARLSAAAVEMQNRSMS